MLRDANYQTPSRGADVLILTYPAQGHINPMLQFAKRLAYKGLKVTLITTSSVSFQTLSNSSNNLDHITIFDGFQEGRLSVDDVDANLQHLRASICQSLHELLGHYKESKTNLHPTPKMVIYNSIMPWVLDVLTKYGIEGAPFFTQSCVVNSIYYYVHEGDLKSPRSELLVSLPSIKELLRFDDLPTFVSSPSIYQAVVGLLVDQFSNIKEAHCLFVNTVDTLEIEAANWMASKWSLKTIGPTIPSMYLDKRLLDDKEYGPSLFEPETNTCRQWLDAKESGSVVYVSMGSMASLSEEQMEELAIGLENCSKYFLWVVRASEENKVPLNFKEVLAHRAIGCFLTHCGWNSTLEAISLGVPMVAFPQWTDQPTNAKCITDYWKVGTRVKANENGIVTRHEIYSCIKEVTEGERAKEIKNNAIKWKQLAKQAMEEGGNSDRAIEEFVAKLLNT